MYKTGNCKGKPAEQYGLLKRVTVEWQSTETRHMLNGLNMAATPYHTNTKTSSSLDKLRFFTYQAIILLIFHKITDSSSRLVRIMSVGLLIFVQDNVFTLSTVVTLKFKC